MPHAQLCEVCKGLFGLLPSVSAVVKDAHAWLEVLVASKSHLNFWKFLCPSPLLLDSLDKRRKTVKGLGGRRTPLLQSRYKDNTLLGTGKREEEVDEDIEPAVLQPVQLLLLHQQLSPLFLLLLSLASLWCVQNVFGSQKSSRKDLWPLHLRVFQFFKNSFWLNVAYLQELSLCLCIYVGIPKYCCASFTTVRILHWSKLFTFFSRNSAFCSRNCSNLEKQLHLALLQGVGELPRLLAHYRHLCLHPGETTLDSVNIIYRDHVWKTTPDSTTLKKQTCQASVEAQQVGFQASAPPPQPDLGFLLDQLASNLHQVNLADE